jgi:hypothetical protein
MTSNIATLTNKFRHAECRIYIVILSAIMLNVVMLNGLGLRVEGVRLKGDVYIKF